MIKEGTAIMKDKNAYTDTQNFFLGVMVGLILAYWMGRTFLH